MQAETGSAVERAQSGDNEAFRLLVEQHSRAIFRLAFRMTANEHDAEDVVQETFLRAYRQLPRYEARSSFSTWLYRIAANYALDLIRIRRRHEEKRRRDSSEGGDLLQTIAETRPGPDRAFYGDEVTKSVSAALDQLSAQERTAFLLRHFEGLSIAEIGLALGTGTNATKHSIFRAVRKLRKALEPLVGVAK